jgi:hypothetical protein
MAFRAIHCGIEFITPKFFAVKKKMGRKANLIQILRAFDNPGGGKKSLANGHFYDLEENIERIRETRPSSVHR